MMLIHVLDHKHLWISMVDTYLRQLQGFDKVMPKSLLSLSPLVTQHQEVMPKSCLSVFPHCERKRQNNPFQIRTFHFHPFFSSLCLRFTVSSLPTFFPKQVYLYGVLWVAMAPLHRKRPRQFVSSYSFERVAVLGHIILLNARKNTKTLKNMVAL